jgi:hypothetical protein
LACFDHTDAIAHLIAAVIAHIVGDAMHDKRYCPISQIKRAMELAGRDSCGITGSRIIGDSVVTRLTRARHKSFN